MIHIARHPVLKHCLDCNRALDRRNKSGRCKSCRMAEENRSREKRALASARETAEIRDRDARLLALRAAGMSWRAIGQVLGGVSRQTVNRRWQILMARQGVIPPNPVIDHIKLADNDVAKRTRVASDKLVIAIRDYFSREASRRGVSVRRVELEANYGAEATARAFGEAA